MSVAARRCCPTATSTVHTTTCSRTCRWTPCSGARQHAAGACHAARRRRHVQARASADANNTTVLKRQRQQAAATVQPTVQHSSAPAVLGTSSAHDGDIMRLAVPALLALAADPLLGVIDTAFVGQLGGDNLAALGVNTSLFSLCFVVFNFLATATTTLVASAVSKHDRTAAGEVAWQATGLALLLGCSVAALLWTNGSAALVAMGIDPSQQQLHDLAMTYLVWRAGAAPAVLLVTVGQGMFRGLQNMRTPLLITILTNVVHLGLDGLFIFGLHMGLQGAAISTTASEWAAAGLYMALLWQQRQTLGLWPPPVLTWQQMRSRYMPFMQASSAVLLRTGALLGTKTMATAVATRLGTSAVASHQVLMQLWVLTSMLVDSLAVAGQTLIAVKLSGGQSAEARQVAERLLQLGLALGLGIAGVLGVSSPLWPRVFTSDAGVLDQIRALVPLAVLPLPINALVYTLDGVLVGASDFGYLMSAMVAVSGVAAGLLLCVEPCGWGLQGVWAAMAALMLGRLAALGLRYQSAQGPLPPANTAGGSSGSSGSSSSSSSHVPPTDAEDVLQEREQEDDLLEDNKTQ